MLHSCNSINHIHVYFDETTESRDKINLFIRSDYLNMIFWMSLLLLNILLKSERIHYARWVFGVGNEQQKQINYILRM